MFSLFKIFFWIYFKKEIYLESFLNHFKHVSLFSGSYSLCGKVTHILLIFEKNISYFLWLLLRLFPLLLWHFFFILTINCFDVIFLWSLLKFSRKFLASICSDIAFFCILFFFCHFDYIYVVLDHVPHIYSSVTLFSHVFLLVLQVKYFPLL